MGMGEGSPLCDPGSELYYRGGDSSASITVYGMEKIIPGRSEVYYCC